MYLPMRQIISVVLAATVTFGCLWYLYQQFFVAESFGGMLGYAAIFFLAVGVYWLVADLRSLIAMDYLEDDE